MSFSSLSKSGIPQRGTVFRNWKEDWEQLSKHFGGDAIWKSLEGDSVLELTSAERVAVGC